MDRLIKYEQHFKTAYKAKYVRNLRLADKVELQSIHKELFGTSPNINCNGCVFNMVYKLAEHYYGLQQNQCEEEQERKQVKRKSKRTSASK